MLRPHFLAVLTIVAAACSSDSGSAPGQGGTVRATIYGPESWGDEPGPLAGVNVTIAGRSEITNELGVAYVDQLPSGLQAARIDRPGSELLETQVSVVVGDTVDMIEELLALRPTQGRIEVQVVTQQSPGSPVDILLEGAVVTLDQLSFRITDATGRAEFPFASAGGHWVRGEYTGTVPDSILIQLLGGDTVRVTLRLDLVP
jgi:hypothetical protein